MNVNGRAVLNYGPCPLSALDTLISNLEGLNLVKGKDFVVNVKNSISAEDEDEKPTDKPLVKKTYKKKIVEDEDDAGFGEGF